MHNDINESESLPFVEEGFVADVQVFLHELMTEKKVSRAELARRMGVSRARISQIFSDDCKNLTVRLLAKATHALGEAPSIDSPTIRRLREERERKHMAAAISKSVNVVSLWTEVSEDADLDEWDCGASDVRLDSLVEQVRAAGRSR